MDLRVATDLPDIVVDVGRLELLLTNLLSNAIKYSDPAKSNRFVDVSLEGISESACVFHVADNGIGMNREQLQKLFSPFYRGHADRDAELGVEGLGLGLGIVRDVAQAIGAQIRVDSNPGVGSTFTVTLPLRPATSTLLSPRWTPPTGNESTPQSRQLTETAETSTGLVPSRRGRRPWRIA